MINFKATLDDGSTVTDAEFPSVINLPIDRVVELCVTANALPPVTLKADLKNGERVHCFTRVAMSLTGNVTTQVVVFEVQKEGRIVCRLYWHPMSGPILSTQDLYF